MLITFWFSESICKQSIKHFIKVTIQNVNAFNLSHVKIMIERSQHWKLEEEEKGEKCRSGQLHHILHHG